MAKYQKGHKGGPGRPLGSITIKNCLRTALEQHNFDVIKEYLKAVHEIDKPDKKAEAIRYLIDFIYPKPTQRHDLKIEDVLAAAEHLVAGADTTTA